MPWWISAAFVASLVVTVVAVSVYFLPVMFTPPVRVPDFEDVDRLAKVSRQSALPRKRGCCGSFTAGNNRGGFPDGFPPSRLAQIPGNPHRVDGRNER